MMSSGDNPAVPLGASSSSSTGKGAEETTFVFGYKLSDWSSKVTGSKPFAIPLPTNDNKNYGTSISGVKDLKGETFPVSLSFTTSNPSHPICGHRYEAPYIGTSDSGSSVTNRAPAAQAMNLIATVSNLTVGSSYNLYTYKWTERPLPSGSLAIPSSDFNANAARASSVVTFTASAPTVQTSFSIHSSDTIALRVVLAKSGS